MTKTAPKKPTQLRCAIYTRKSTEEGLEQEFNTLDAQREAGLAYIKSQASEGWVALPTRYDDGGCTGANMLRPALQQLLQDIEAGSVDCVVVYKVDRLSRSLLDFAKLMQLFEQHGTAFVSVTQQFHTGSSMGRLVLNVLLSFAQFERELISERTRDKIAATRRKGKWTGGNVLLGYEVQNSKLVILPDEADRVRTIFKLYLECGSLLKTLKHLEQRGWHTKPRTTKSGVNKPSVPFQVTTLHHLLTNVLYRGMVRYKDELHPGEHEPIVDEKLWNAVQTKLQQNAVTGHRERRNTSGALLRGLLKCVACDSAMTPTHTKRGRKRYRYYTCSAGLKAGRAKCPTPNLNASTVEQLVIQQIARIGQDPSLFHSVMAEYRGLLEQQASERDIEERLLRNELKTLQTEEQRLLAAIQPNQANEPILKRLQQLATKREELLAKLAQQQRETPASLQPEDTLREQLARFEPLWKKLTTSEQERLLKLLIDRIDYHADRGSIKLHFHPTAFKTLGELKK